MLITFSTKPGSVTPLDLDLTEPIDIYSEWIDAADAAQREEPPRRSVASTSRGITRAPAYESDDDWNLLVLVFSNAL